MRIRSRDCFSAWRVPSVTLFTASTQPLTGHCTVLSLDITDVPAPLESSQTAFGIEEIFREDGYRWRFSVISSSCDSVIKNQSEMDHCA